MDAYLCIEYGSEPSYVPVDVDANGDLVFCDAAYDVFNMLGEEEYNQFVAAACDGKSQYVSKNGKRFNLTFAG